MFESFLQGIKSRNLHPQDLVDFLDKCSLRLATETNSILSLHGTGTTKEKISRIVECRKLLTEAVEKVKEEESE